AAPVAAAAAVAPAAAAESTFGLRPRFVHRQRTAAHLVLIELAGGFLRFFVRRHLHESEPARAAGRRITHDAHRFNGAGLAEQFLEFSFTGRVGKVAHVKPHTHYALLMLKVAGYRSPGSPRLGNHSEGAREN